MMKIAVWHNLPSGGGKRALYDHVSGLVARGHEVEVWAPPTAHREYLPLGRIVREHIVPLDHQWKWSCSGALPTSPLQGASDKSNGRALRAMCTGDR